MTIRYEIPARPAGVRPYDWALRQLRVPAAHRVTRGSENVVIALIDLGYRHHPALDGHLWQNPGPARGDIHGWDFVDQDDTLEYAGPGEDTSLYFRGHHVFVAGEIAAIAPACPLMLLRWGWKRPASLADSIRYAVEHGAKVLVIPHGYLTGDVRDGIALFYRGTDFSYPEDNPDLRRALEEAWDAGCLIFKGTADNRGRRVAVASIGMDAVAAVGSTNRAGQPADICCSADYVDVAAPGGDRRSEDWRDRIWGYGGDNNLIPFTGGCMACGFAGGVAGLLWARFPQLANGQIRQILRNTARGPGWDPLLGWGILDAARAVGLKDDQIPAALRIDRRRCNLTANKGKPVLTVRLENRGALDIGRAMVVAYNGDPRQPAAPEGTRDKPVLLRTSQIGHAIGPVRGLHQAELAIALTALPAGGHIWLEACNLDHHAPDGLERARVSLGANRPEPRARRNAAE